MSEIEREHHSRPYYFPMTISLGNLLTILTLASGIFAFVYGIGERLTRVEDRLASVDINLAQINRKLGTPSRSDAIPVWTVPK